ncbi:MAG: nucleotidyltransferase family protein [Candidatus Hydrogenedentes bacterium]|nr:nucleotidyltransferase family protein [Candidatus Hydrogenedentota bacterium]
MNTHPDFEELFQLLEKHRVDYMIVGGYAVAYHGYPRFTKDLDIFYDSSLENIERIRHVLLEFGFEPNDLSEKTFSEKGAIITFGVAPSRVDFLNDIDGVQFSAAKKQTVRGKYGKVHVSFISLDDLIKNKRATLRSQDKVDADELVQIRDRCTRQ